MPHKVGAKASASSPSWNFLTDLFTSKPQFLPVPWHTYLRAVGLKCSLLTVSQREMRPSKRKRGGREEKGRAGWTWQRRCGAAGGSLASGRSSPPAAGRVPPGVPWRGRRSADVETGDAGDSGVTERSRGVRPALPGGGDTLRGPEAPRRWAVGGFRIGQRLKPVSSF